MPAPTCKVCDTGTLEPRSINRMGPVVVFIGWILLIPSLLGAAGAGIGVVVSILAGGGAAAASASADDDSLAGTRRERMLEEYGATFDKVGLPRATLEQVVEDPLTVTPEFTASMSREQKQAVQQLASVVKIDEAALQVAAGAGVAAAGLGVIFFMGLGVASIVSGLLGWLLVQKKRVLQCVKCSAVVAAS